MTNPEWDGKGGERSEATHHPTGQTILTSESDDCVVLFDADGNPLIPAPRKIGFIDG